MEFAKLKISFQADWIFAAFLNEPTPLALSRKRDAWVFVGAGIVAILMLLVVIISLAIVVKRKKANSVVLPPPTQGILKRDKETSVVTLGIDNTLYTSETEARVIRCSNHLINSTRHPNV